MRQRVCFDDRLARKSYPTFGRLWVVIQRLRSRDDYSFSLNRNLSFAGLQLFWRFPEKNGTASILILQLYSYLGDFLKKTVDRPFRFFSCTVILEIS